MSRETALKVEFLEQYFGDADNVKRLIDNCPSCGAKLVFSHLPDHRNCYIQETAKCLECGGSSRKTIHKLN